MNHYRLREPMQAARRDLPGWPNWQLTCSVIAVYTYWYAFTSWNLVLRRQRVRFHNLFCFVFFFSDSTCSMFYYLFEKKKQIRQYIQFLKNKTTHFVIIIQIYTLCITAYIWVQRTYTTNVCWLPSSIPFGWYHNKNCTSWQCSAYL